MNNTPNATLIPVKFRVVRELATEELKHQASLIRRDLDAIGAKYIEHLESKNNALFCRLGIIKREEIPSLETVVQGWKSDWKNASWIEWSTPMHILNRTISDWWSDLTFFSNLPESRDDDIMYLSIADAKLIKYRES